MVEVEDYKLLSSLGQGVSGQVYVAEKKDDKKLYALKFIDRFYKDQQKEEQVILQLEQEVNAIEMVTSDRVIKSTECFTTENFFVIVMEYCKNGDLFNFVMQNNHLQESQAMELFAQILDGIKAVHSTSLIHRDIKPENLLLDDNFNIKIGDFGASIIYDKENLLDNLCGTYYYMAPEMENLEEYDYSVDLWSIGCVLFFMLTGNFSTSQLQISNCISEYCDSCLDVDKLIQLHVSKRTISTDHKISISNEVKDLISQMLRSNPKHRIPFGDILKHAALQKYRQNPSVKKLLNQEKAYSQIYSTTFTRTFTNLNSNNKKHDFSPQKSKNMILNTSYINLPTLVNLNSCDDTNKKQKSLLLTFNEIDEVLYQQNQHTNNAQILGLPQLDSFEKKKSSKARSQQQQQQTPPQFRIVEGNVQNDADFNYSIFSIHSDELLEDQQSVSSKIQQYNTTHLNIQMIKNKISSDPNSPNFRSLDLAISPVDTQFQTPQNNLSVLKSPLSQFCDISPIQFNKIK